MRLMLAACLAGLIFTYRSLGIIELDGSVWDVKVRAKSLFGISRKDTLVFERGRFTSTRYLAAGYWPGGYYAMSVPESRSGFEASLEREDGSKLSWKGTVRGERMKGVVTLTRADGKIKTYSFKGRRKS